MKIVVWWIIAISLSMPLIAQTPRKSKARAAVTAEDIQALRDALAAQRSMLAAQQQQIQELKQELERRDQVWQQSQQQLQSAQATARNSQSKVAAKKKYQWLTCGSWRCSGDCRALAERLQFDMIYTF